MFSCRASDRLIFPKNKRVLVSVKVKALTNREEGNCSLVWIWVLGVFLRERFGLAGVQLGWGGDDVEEGLRCWGCVSSCL